MDAKRKAHMAAIDAEYAALLRRNTEDNEAKDEAEREAGSLLDGAPPVLPPPTMLPEPLKLGADTDWAETKPFVDAVKDLLELRAKPVARFVGMFSPTQLREVSDFLMAVAAADKKETAPPPESKTNTVADVPDIPACLDRRPAKAEAL
jgi:hypothetical protein